MKTIHEEDVGIEMEEGEVKEGGGLEVESEDATLLAVGDTYDEEDSDYGSGDEEIQKKHTGFVERYKGWVWMGLSVLAMLNGRRNLGGDFPFPLYWVFLTQFGAYVSVALAVLLVRLLTCRRAKTISEDKNTRFERFVVVVRTLGASCAEGVAILCAAEAVTHFQSLPLLAMLPVLTYVFDSLLFRLAYYCRVIPQDQDVSGDYVYNVGIVFICVTFSIYEDYRLNLRPLFIALGSLFFHSLSKVISQIRPRIEKKGVQTWETPLRIYLWAAIPPLFLAGYQAARRENLPAAREIAGSWSLIWRVFNLGPGMLLYILFRSSMNSAYPFISKDHVAGALEETTTAATQAITNTLQSGFWVLVFGVCGREKTFVDWFQVVSFTTIYVVCVGPKHIGYYPPRALNLISRMIRRRPIPIHQEPWQFSIFLTTTTVIFAILISCNVMFWSDTLAFNHNLKAWIEPGKVSVDAVYRPPQMRNTEIVIAHSADEDFSIIETIIQEFGKHEILKNTHPKVSIYTKSDYNVTESLAREIKASTGFRGALVVESLSNVGGTTATYLDHILNNYDELAIQTIFLSTATTTHSTIPLIRTRLENHYLQPGLPIPDAVPKTAFLNLGEQESCNCNSCFDSTGWEDSFHLIPSMYGATHPTSKTCNSVLITRGNNFIASAGRLRGIKRDIWKMLYDALMNEDLRNSWAHEHGKFPAMVYGEKGRGRWAEGSVYGRKDSLENPWLGLTIERLWGILLQCGSGLEAWACPGFERGWRRWGDGRDCGCVD